MPPPPLTLPTPTPQCRYRRRPTPNATTSRYQCSTTTPPLWSSEWTWGPAEYDQVFSWTSLGGAPEDQYHVPIPKATVPDSSCESNFTKWGSGYPKEDTYGNPVYHDFAYSEREASFLDSVLWKSNEGGGIDASAYCVCEAPSEVNTPKPSAAPTVLCGLGTVRSEAKDGSCVPCEAGKYSSEAGSDQCSFCTSGKFSSAGSALCDVW